MKMASGDFEKMFAAFGKFRLIKKSAGGKGTLRQMRNNDDQPEERDHNDDDDDDDEQWAVEVAANLNTISETLLAAIGKGACRGQQGRFEPTGRPNAPAPARRPLREQQHSNNNNNNEPPERRQVPMASAWRRAGAIITASQDTSVKTARWPTAD